MTSTSFARRLVSAPLLALAACGPGAEPPVLVIETFNVGLAGAFLPYEDARREPIADALATDDADVVCVQEAWRAADKELIAARAAEAFPHVVSFAHDASTPLDDPTDQTGQVPADPPGPPCASAEALAALDEAIACLAASCSTIPGSEEGQTTSTSCAEAECSASAAALLTGGPELLRCYGCLAPGLPTETLADLRATCSAGDGGLAFGGQSGVMILSKHPILEEEDWVLPGTWNQRVIARARIDAPGGEVEVHCHHLTPVFDGFTYPYTGLYGEGDAGEGGWLAEQLLQAEKLTAFVDARAQGLPTVVLGDFNAGPSSSGVFAEGLPTYQALTSRFASALPEGFVPACTYCPATGTEGEGNLVNGGELPVWIDHIFLDGAWGAVVGAERVFTERVVSAVDATGAPIEVELSDHYGLRATVARAP
jgi:endonuclease/exonuclease/phosphatase family metal-dependent hydrolase